MHKLEIFDPAMCCSTGVCGPGVDRDLVRMASAFYSLEKREFDVARYNLANDPGQFAANETINQLLQKKGPDVLPVTLLDGKVVKESSYPSNQELSDWLHLDVEKLNDKPRQRVTINIDQFK